MILFVINKIEEKKTTKRHNTRNKGDKSLKSNLKDMRHETRFLEACTLFKQQQNVRQTKLNYCQTT